LIRWLRSTIPEIREASFCARCFTDRALSVVCKPLPVPYTPAGCSRAQAIIPGGCPWGATGKEVEAAFAPTASTGSMTLYLRCRCIRGALAGGAGVNSALQKFGEQQHIILRHRAIAGDFTFGPLGLGASRDLWAAGIPCKSVEIVCAASRPGYGTGNSSR
jgi:hypothetical protein